MNTVAVEDKLIVFITRAKIAWLEQGVLGWKLLKKLQILAVFFQRILKTAILLM